MRTAIEEYYHVFNRGMQKQPIFIDDYDRLRFLFLILTFQGKQPIKRVKELVKKFSQHRMLTIDQDIVDGIVKDRMVELIVFTCMDNHFHLTIREKIEGGTAKYMQRVLNAYTKYFNIRHQKSGHLFQNSYKSVHVQNDDQLLYLSAYSHKNIIELANWKDRMTDYPWSSFQDYTNSNRWGPLLVTDVILDKFSNGFEYKKFVETGIAKTIQKKKK